MLKTKITKADFDALDAALKPFYVENGGAYFLQSDDAEEARRAKDREKTRADEAERKLADIQRERDEAERVANEAREEADREKARKANDHRALEDSYKVKLETQKVEFEKTIAKLTGQLNNALITGKAEAIAAEISTVPELLVPAIERRLQADLTGEKGIVRILDANGQPSALSYDELKKEFVDNKRYASIIKATNASGGGANNDDHSGGGAADGKKIKDMSEAERVALHKADPAGYRTRAQAEGIPVGMAS